MSSGILSTCVRRACASREPGVPNSAAAVLYTPISSRFLHVARRRAYLPSRSVLCHRISQVRLGILMQTAPGEKSGHEPDGSCRRRGVNAAVNMSCARRCDISWPSSTQEAESAVVWASLTHGAHGTLPNTSGVPK
jgi:hypothetical protein